MWSSSGRRVLQELLSLRAVRGFRGTAAQNTVVVERWWQVPLSRVGRPPRLHPRRHRIYRLVEDKKNLPQEKLELILTETVPKLGGRGDTVFVRKSIGRNKLLAQGLAVYASPENKQTFAEELKLLQEGSSEERTQTRTGQLTVEYLRKSKLTFRQMPCEEFQITKDVVIRQLERKLGVVAQPHTVNFPFESAKDVGDYWCEITVNRLDTVRVPISVLPYEDMSAKYQRQLKAQRKPEAAANATVATEAAADVPVSTAVAADVPVSVAADVPVSVAADVPVSTAVAADVPVSTAVAADVPVSVAADVPVSTAVAADVPVSAEADVPMPAAEATADVSVEAAADVSATAAADISAEAVVDVPASAAAEVPAADIAAEEKDDGVLKAASSAVLQAEAVKEAAGKSADEETAAPSKTTPETTAPASENPEKK
ncbi:large ribosomal subunit protein bL9m isoform X2 [Salarias fasciatus]|uniref:large ribosomal subunit protein bL9m isoform X2 n=1 Tax=Salarias fasciatus TaxID=181472 RepID=UPI00117682DB|nr:39S ribosomal protein L9, mitochondrial isoform X2 [Salarias fasciatus]